MWELVLRFLLQESQRPLGIILFTQFENDFRQVFPEVFTPFKNRFKDDKSENILSSAFTLIKNEDKDIISKRKNKKIFERTNLEIGETNNINNLNKFKI